MSELSQGTQINGRYTLQEYKGSGSFGEVWLAHDNIVDADVALKIYVSLNPAGISQFTDEYKTTANLSHSNLLTTKHFDVWERRPFLEMKYCGRGSADNLVGNITETELWHFIHDVAAGLHYLHNLSTPIIHQDIKPDNIMLDEGGQFLITDFGISKQLRATIRKQSGRSDASGSCAYMGPERFSADPTPIKASDIWSLGASIYELAKGELPFYGQGGVMLKNGADLPELGDGWSTELNQTIQACLAKDPWDRPTAEQLEKYAESMLQSLETGCSMTWDPSWIKNKATKRNYTPDVGRNTVSVNPSTIGNRETNLIGEVKGEAGLNASNGKKGQQKNWKWMNIILAILLPLPGLFWADSLKRELSQAHSEYAALSKKYSQLNNDKLQIEGSHKQLEKDYSLLQTSYNALDYSVKKAPIIITNIEMENHYYDGRVETGHGKRIYASQTMFLCPRITYLGKQTGNNTIKVKFYDSNGNLSRGNTSPNGYSYTFNLYSNKGKVDVASSSGWGGKEKGSWRAGQYRIEIYDKNDKLLASHNFTIY